MLINAEALVAEFSVKYSGQRHVHTCSHDRPSVSARTGACLCHQEGTGSEGGKLFREQFGDLIPDELWQAPRPAAVIQ
jgi:hypothetical protein